MLSKVKDGFKHTSVIYTCEHCGKDEASPADGATGDLPQGWYADFGRGGGNQQAFSTACGIECRDAHRRALGIIPSVEQEEVQTPA